MSKPLPLGESDYIRVNQSIFCLRNIYESRMKRENTDSSFNLGIGEMGVLMVIGQNEDITAQELSARMDLTKGTVSIYVKRLMGQDYIAQKRNPDDRRLWNLSLTPRGRDLYSGACEGTIEYTKDILSPLAPEEQRLLYTLLTKLARGNGYDWV